MLSKMLFHILMKNGSEITIIPSEDYQVTTMVDLEQKS